VCPPPPASPWLDVLSVASGIEYVSGVSDWIIGVVVGEKKAKRWMEGSWWKPFVRREVRVVMAPEEGQRRRVRSWESEVAQGEEELRRGGWKVSLGGGILEYFEECMRWLGR
jgi:hypothetical protein